MLDKKRWKDLQGAQAYEVNKSVLVSTTDVRKSNSAAMYLALTSYAFNGGEVVTDRNTAQKAAAGVDVRVLIPERPDNLLTWLADKAFRLETGMRDAFEAVASGRTRLSL